MYTDKKVQEFCSQAIPPFRNECFKVMRKYYEENIEELSDDIVVKFKELLSIVKEMQQDGAFGSLSNIALSPLRSGHLINKNRLCKMDVFDDDINSGKFHLEIDFPWIRGHITKFEEDISIKAKSHGMHLPPYTIESIIIEELGHFFDIIYFLLRYSIPKIKALDEWSIIDRYGLVHLRYGEYHSTKEILYSYDTRTLDLQEIKQKLESNKAILYESIKNLDLSNGSYDNSDWRFTDFSGSNFEGSSLKNSSLIGTSWRNCNLDGADFSGANLSGADFRDASMEETNFCETILTKVLW